MTPSATQLRSAETTDQTAIRPFRVDVAESELTDLRRRIKATRLPEKEPVADMSQGVPLATIEKLTRYWANEYRLAQVRSEVQRLPGLHHRDRRPGLPLHSCPLDTRERPADHRHARLARLDRRTAQDHRATDQSDSARWQRIGRIPCRRPVDAGLRILGKANLDRLGPRPHRTRLGGVDESSGLHALRGDTAVTGAGSSRT